MQKKILFRQQTQVVSGRGKPPAYQLSTRISISLSPTPVPIPRNPKKIGSIVNKFTTELPPAYAGNAKHFARSRNIATIYKNTFYPKKTERLSELTDRIETVKHTVTRRVVPNRRTRLIISNPSSPRNFSPKNNDMLSLQIDQIISAANDNIAFSKCVNSHLEHLTDHYKKKRQSELGSFTPSVKTPRRI